MRGELFEFYSDAFVYTACFLCNMDNYYIVIGKFFIFVTDNKFPIEVFDFNGNFVKRINDSNEGTEKIICYYDELTSKQFIISIYGNSLKSFYFDENKVYHKYSENNSNKNINDDNSENYDNNIDNEINLIIYKEDKIIKLIGLNNEGIVRIWNFHSAELLKKLDIIRIYSICLWNNKYLFIGSEDYSIKLIELKNGTIIKSLLGHKDIAFTIKKMIHPKYGECLVSQGQYNEDIKLWILS